MQHEMSPHKETEVDIYDSTASTHMSPNHHRFITFKDTPPHPIAVTNKAIFNATGIGDMRIAVPNDKTTSYIMLKDILYCKDLAFTLITLAWCDKAGFMVLLRDKHCTICDPKGKIVGQIPLMDVFYKAEPKKLTEAINATHKTSSIDELHWRMGHISPAT